jgi:hypothetical protein
MLLIGHEKLPVARWRVKRLMVKWRLSQVPWDKIHEGCARPRINVIYQPLPGNGPSPPSSGSAKIQSTPQTLY